MNRQKRKFRGFPIEMAVAISPKRDRFTIGLPSAMMVEAEKVLGHELVAGVDKMEVTPEFDHAAHRVRFVVTPIIKARQ